MLPGYDKQTQPPAVVGWQTHGGETAGTGHHGGATLVEMPA